MARRRNPSDGLGPQDYDDLINSSMATFRQLNRQTQIAVIVLLVVLAIVVAVIYFRSQRIGPAVTAGDPNLLLGIPSGATPDPSNRDDYLMVKPYYVLSYNNDKGEPNWVSWQVTEQDLGDAPRKQVFDPDTTLPIGFKVVTSRDYNGSGFDRGHMCPHGDRSANVEMSYATFVMTNIIPQAPNVNRKAWAQLETYCRELVRRHNHLYIMSGPIGQGGTGSRGFKESLAGGKVSVPAECWKVAVVVEEGPGDDLSRISMGTRVIAVDVPNDNDSVGEEWAQFRTSPAQIEQKTGLHFFTSVRPDIAAALRQRVDDVPIPPPRPLVHEHD
ncbi:MAG TPA: DNA/RNA non-specific endonuclease [Tepidisphaeraceae bacterium]|jgi:endonuclease G